jgi:ankyrin repeat protein
VRYRSEMEGTGQNLDAAADTFVDLACLCYQPADSVARRRRASRLLAEAPALVGSSVYAAALVGDVATVRRLLDAEPGLATRKGGPRVWEPLMYLCYGRVTPAREGWDPVAAARLLLERGADPGTRFFMNEIYLFTPLTGAAGDGEGGPTNQPPHPQGQALAELLLDAGADPNEESQALYNTHFERSNHWLELLLSRGLRADRPVNWAPERMGTLDYLLGQSVRQGYQDRVTLLLAHGASAEGRHFYNHRTHLENALLDGHAQIAALLVRHGARAAALTPSEQLRAAFLRADAEEVRRLSAAAIEGRDDAATLIAAVGHGSLAAARMLLDAGVSASVSTPQGLTALHVAAQHGHRLVVEELLARGAALEVREPVYGGTPLGRATYFWKKRPSLERAEVVRFLAARSTNPFDVVFAGAADRLAALLAEDPSRATARRPNGITPLHVLAERDVPDPLPLLDLLLRHGAAPDAPDERGRTPLDLARETEAEDLAAALAARGGSSDAGHRD